MAMNGYSKLNCIGWWGHSSGALNPHQSMQFSVIHRTDQWQWTGTLHWTASGGEDTVLELWILTTRCISVSYTGQTNGNERVLYTETASGGEDTDLQLWILTTRCSSVSYTEQSNGNERLLYTELHLVVRIQFWSLNPHHPMQFSGHTQDRLMAMNGYSTLNCIGCEDTVLELWILTTRCSLVSYTGQTNGNGRVLYTELRRVVRTQFWSFESSPPDAVQCHTQNSLMAMKRVLYTELHLVVRIQFWSFGSSPPDSVQCYIQNL